MNTSELHQQVESLRDILEVEQLRAVTFEEAEGIADSLIQFYEVLAETVDCDE